MRIRMSYTVIDENNSIKMIIKTYQEQAEQLTCGSRVFCLS